MTDNNGVFNTGMIKKGLVVFFIAFFVSKSFASEVSFYIYEAPGRSVTSIVNENDDSRIRYDYDVFGKIKSKDGTLNNNFEYVGECSDPESGLIYLRRRYYNPEVGRFISRDIVPGYVEEPQGINPYVYCKNNPVKYIDPSGNEGVAAIAGSIIGAAWGFGSTAVGNAITGEISPWYDYVGNTLGGATSGFISGASFNPVIAGAAGGALSNVIKQWGKTIAANKKGESYEWQVGSYIRDVTFSAAFAKVDSLLTPAVRGALPTKNLDTFLFGAHAEAKYFGKFQSDILESSLAVLGIKEGISTLISTGYESAISNTVGSGSFNLGSDIYATPSFMSANYGGVSLSKTAELLTDITEVKGAVYDDKTGQVILIGKQNLALPQMRLEDLAVAVNSVYAGTDPGVSIDPPLVNNLFSVRYDGLTTQTEFGWTMFESDRIMKCLALGKDNISGQPFSSSVSGYKSLLTLYRESNSFPEGESSHRFWFKPKEVKLVESPDGSSMVFNAVSMEVLTESKFQDNVVGDLQSEAFAQHLTDHYSEYAQEFPILKDLERLGKVTSIVKWIKDNDIPIDLSFINNYQVPAYSTPTNTPATTVSTQWQDGSIIKTVTLTGGVTYTKPNEYLVDSIANPVADPLKQAALNQRPAETDFKWAFTSPENESLTAVAESFARSRKDGNLRFAATDLSYPADCAFALSFSRYYDSFYDKSSSLGYGWEMRPYQIRFPESKQNFTFGSSNLVLSLYSQVFVIDRSQGKEEAYLLLGIDSSNLPLYANSADSSVLRQMTDQTLVLSFLDNTKITFDNQGNLISTTDKNAKSITYVYQNGRLNSISAGAAGTITLTYTGERVTAVAGPGPRTITYGYDAGGCLVSVTNAQNQAIRYAYDTDKRITRIIDPKNNTVFEGTYDDYNRLTNQTFNNELDFGRDFSLGDRSTEVTDPNARTSLRLYDDKYRLTSGQDYSGNEVGGSYVGKVSMCFIINYAP